MMEHADGKSAAAFLPVEIVLAGQGVSDLVRSIPEFQRSLE
jgi:hypothetical protein